MEYLINWRARQELVFRGIPQGEKGLSRWGRCCREWASLRNRDLQTTSHRVSTWSKALLSDEQVTLGLAYAVECIEKLQEGHVHQAIAAASAMLEDNAQPKIREQAALLLSNEGYRYARR